MDGVKAFLTRQIGPFPVYVYMAGVVALIGGVWYFKTHSSGTTAVQAAAQTNYPTNGTSGTPTDGINPVPLPYPTRPSGIPTVGNWTPTAPSPAFTTPPSPPGNPRYSSGAFGSSGGKYFPPFPRGGSGSR